MMDYRNMRDHLLVDELVGFGDLNDTIQQENPAVPRGFDHADMLELRRFLCHFLRDTKRLSPVVIEFFGQPIRLQGVHS